VKDTTQGKSVPFTGFDASSTTAAAGNTATTKLETKTRANNFNFMMASL
jgi:hypothetical protein